MTDFLNNFLPQLIRILFRYIAAVLVTKGMSNDPIIALLQDDVVIQTVAGLMIATLTETAWLNSYFKGKV